MIRIENPLPGKPNEIGLAAAERMLMRGSAVESARVNGELVMIRRISIDPSQKAGRVASAERGYDEVDRSFFREAAHVPIIAPIKMLRHEKSPREWSFRVAVRSNMGHTDTPEEVKQKRSVRFYGKKEPAAV